MKLNRRYKRSIKANISFYISATLLTVITLFVFYLLNISGTGVNSFADDFFKKQKLEDGEFSVYYDIPDDEMSKLEEEYDLTIEAQRYINLKEGDTDIRVFSRTEEINLYEITEGSDVSSDSEVIISEGYARNKNVDIGDDVTINGKEYEVSGYFQRPDYLHMLEFVDSGYKNIDTFFLAYLSDKEFEQFELTPTQYFVRYNDSDRIKDFRRAVNEKYVMQDYLSASENPRIKFVHEKADLYLTCSYLLLLILPLIAVIIICIIISRKVRSEQKLIGTLSAQGYKNRTLIMHYAGFAVIPGILGGIFSYVLAAIFAQPYGEMGLTDYEPIKVDFKLSPLIGIAGLLVPTVMYLCAAVLTVRRLLKNDVVTLLNGGAGKSERMKRLFVNSRMSFRKKYALRSLIGNPTRTLVVFLGIFLGSFIMFFGLSLDDSVSRVSDEVIEDAGSYEYEYVLNNIRTGKPEQGAPVIVSSFEAEDGTVIPLYGTDSDNPYLTFKDKDGRQPDYSNGYYITNTTAFILGLSAGDTFKVYNPLTLEENELKVYAVLDNDVQKGIFTSRENAELLTHFEPGAYNAIMSREELDIDDSELVKTIRLSSVAEQCNKLVDEMAAVIWLLVFIGALICIAAVYVAVDMMLSENQNNISMLKVLGYKDKKINSFVLRANHILLPLGILLSIPLIYMSGKYFYMSDAQNSGIIIHTVISLRTYILTIAAVSLSYFGSLFIISKRIKKISMVESMKDNRE